MRELVMAIVAGIIATVLGGLILSGVAPEKQVTKPTKQTHIDPNKCQCDWAWFEKGERFLNYS